MSMFDALDIMRRLLRTKREMGQWDGGEKTGFDLIWSVGLFTASEIIEHAPDAIRAEVPPTEPAPCS